jgi:hypothetical protein
MSAAVAAMLLSFAGGCARDVSVGDSPAAQRATDDNPDVRAGGMRDLAEIGDRPSIEILVTGLEDESESVRREAQLGLAKSLKREIYFDPSQSPEDRSRAASEVRKMWENLKERDLVDAAKQRMPFWYFYDLNTHEVFEDHAGIVPVETASGPHAGMPAGVRAVVLACRNCQDSSDRYVGWLEIPTKALRRYGIPYDGSGAREGKEAIAIRRPEGGNWALEATAAAEEIAAAARRCPQRPIPLLCRPGRP